MRSYPEQKLQKACVKWFRLQYARQSMMLHLNHNESKSARDGSQKKQLGMVAGVADLEYIAPGGLAVFIELKAGGNKQSDKQKLFEKAVTAQGARYHLVSSLGEFMAVIRCYNQ